MIAQWCLLTGIRTVTCVVKPMDPGPGDHCSCRGRTVPPPDDHRCGITASVSVSASYCIPQCVRLIAGVCTHYVVYNISKKKNTVDKSKIKER